VNNNSELSRAERAPGGHVVPGDLPHKYRYQLLSSLIVPRPIGWISTRSGSGVLNLAPYSYFNAISASPPMVAVSINMRRGEPKDTLANIREIRAFCVNVVSSHLLEAMNASSADVTPEVDEFALAGLTPAQGSEVDAPRVLEARASLECTLFKEVDLGEAASKLVIGEVKLIHLSDSLRMEPESWAVDPESLSPVGRLGTNAYSILGEIRRVPRP
jgi:flavin reductase (DIM6/NTAB) family NADH-FMN oxidoreductase RutF